MHLRRLALGTLLAAFNGRGAPGWTLDLAASGIAGYVLFKSNVDAAETLCTSLRAARPDQLIALDEEGGDVTRLWRRSGSPYPGNAALGVADDAGLTRSIYGAIGSHLASVGINLDLAPVVDVNTTAENPVIGTRSFGSSSALVSRHAAAAVGGLQDAGVAACAKHFPGHGATTVDSHLALPTVATTALEPFAAAIAAGCRAVMTAHIRVPSLTGDAPATFSAPALRLLRTDLGFDGVIITDALEMRAATAYAGGIPAGAVLALAAGADLLCIGARVTPELVEAVVSEIVTAVGDGRLAESRLIEAAERVRALAAWSTPSPRASDAESAPSPGHARSAPSPASDARGRAGSPHRSIGAGHRDPAGDGDQTSGAEGIGLVAARRAVVVEGTLPDLSGAFIVQVEATTTIAEGRVAWGLVPHVAAGRIVAVTPNASPLAAAITDEAAGRRIILVGRNLHRLSGAPELIAALAASTDVVVLEMGWPATWRPRDARAFVTTHGASRANSLAAAEALGVISDLAAIPTLNEPE